MQWQAIAKVMNLNRSEFHFNEARVWTWVTRTHQGQFGQQTGERPYYRML